MAAVELNVKINPRLARRLDRLEKTLEPKLRAMLGSSVQVRAGVIRSALERGVAALEREYCPDLVSPVAPTEFGDLEPRITRVTEYLTPRLRSLSGRTPTRSEILCALLERGLDAVEQEYDIRDKGGHVLVHKRTR